MYLFPIVFSSHPRCSVHQLLSGCNNYQAFVSPCPSNFQVCIATNQVLQNTKVPNTYSFSSVRLDLKYKTSKVKGFFLYFLLTQWEGDGAACDWWKCSSIRETPISTNCVSNILWTQKQHRRKEENKFLGTPLFDYTSVFLSYSNEVLRFDLHFFTKSFHLIEKLISQKVMHM